MIFEPAPLKDAWIVRQKPIGDDRGYFARAFCEKEFEEHGIPSRFVQVNTSFSKDVGTLRGLHWQVAPAPEPKFMRCTRGAIYDIMVDMRSDSPTYLQHFGIELTPDNQTMVYIPAYFAHGFLTLQPDSQSLYMVGGVYSPECERGVRWDDPKLGIELPIEPRIVSDKDRSWPLL
jgi:dTDP-4-dehydrorhamnose 3,5-epimerase